MEGTTNVTLMDMDHEAREEGCLTMKILNDKSGCQGHRVGTGGLQDKGLLRLELEGARDRRRRRRKPEAGLQRAVRGGSGSIHSPTLPAQYGFPRHQNTLGQITEGSCRSDQ